MIGKNMGRMLVISFVVLFFLSSIYVGTVHGSENFVVKKNVDAIKGYTSHGVIRINNNTDFANQAAAEGWPGDGTQNNPYIISGYDIDAHGAGDAIYIGNTTVYFVIENCYLHNASYQSSQYFNGDGITLYNVKNGAIENNTCSNNQYEGIHLTSSNNNVISNNTCSNNGNGMDISSSSNNVISNNTCNGNNEYGIYLFGSNSNNNMVSNNNCSNNQDGIYMVGSSNNLIFSNICNYNNYFGIYMSYSTKNVISNNTYKDNGVAIEIVTYSNNNTISSNICDGNNGGGILLGPSSNNNTISNNNCTHNSDGIGLLGSSNNTISNNKCSNNRIGVDISSFIDTSSNNNLVLNNTCNNNSEVGIYISASNNKIYGNKLMNNGIFVWGDKSVYSTQDISTNNTVNGKPIYYYKNANMNNASVPVDAGQVILGNVTWLKIENLYILNSSVAIDIGYSSHITIKNTTCNDNNQMGIYLYFSSNNIIYNNTCSNNGEYGIELDESSSNNLISNNSCNNNSYYGILLASSSNNVIFKNLFANNINYGAYIDSYSSHNLIYNNSFYYNHGSGDIYNSSHVQAYDGGTNNSWNSTTGIGNYWHDWANNNDTNDLNPHDGIVDWPYKIDGGSAKDYYPLKNATYPMPPLAPTAPQNLQASPGNGYVNLTWQKPLGNGSSPITNYKIYRDGVLIDIVSATQLWFNDTSVTNGQTYTYYVTANNSVGESEPSNKVQATPGGAVPEFPAIWLVVITLLLILGTVRKIK